MNQSSFIRARQFKSPLAVIAGFLLRSRETQATRAKDRTQELQQLNKLLEQQRQTIRELEEQLARKNATIDRLETEKQQLRKQPPTLPDDPNLPHHNFGPKIISLCVNLARRIGLRATPDVLQMVFEWLGTKAKLPAWTTVRTWMLRVGVAAIKGPLEKANDWICLADHSNQIGQEKVLSILGVRASNLRTPDLGCTTLSVEIGVSWSDATGCAIGRGES